MLRRFEQHLTDQDWQQVREDIEVKLVPGPEGSAEKFLLARFPGYAAYSRRVKRLIPFIY